MAEFRRQRGRELTSFVEIFCSKPPTKASQDFPLTCHSITGHGLPISSELICVDQSITVLASETGAPLSTAVCRVLAGSGEPGREVPAVIQYYSSSPPTSPSTGPLLLSNLSSAHHSCSLSTVSTGFFALCSILLTRMELCF